MTNPYKRALDKIEVPPELISKTAASIVQAQEKKQRPTATIRFVRYGALAAACIAVGILAIVLTQVFQSGPKLIKTKLEAGSHVAQVELSDGQLSFIQEPDDTGFSPPPLLGGPGTRKETWDTQRYFDYIGAEIAPEYLPPGMALSEESAEVFVSAKGDVLRDDYTARYTSDGGALAVYASKGKLPTQCDPRIPEGSVINGNPLATGASPKDGVYWAQFILSGIGYYIESSGISQEEFIKTLHSFFS